MRKNGKGKEENDKCKGKQTLKELRTFLVVLCVCGGVGVCVCVWRCVCLFCFVLFLFLFCLSHLGTSEIVCESTKMVFLPGKSKTTLGKKIRKSGVAPLKNIPVMPWLK